jgi:hypothetical protein
MCWHLFVLCLGVQGGIAPPRRLSVYSTGSTLAKVISTVISSWRSAGVSSKAISTTEPKPLAPVVWISRLNKPCSPKVKPPKV